MPSEISPYLYYEDAGAAMDWLIEAFGFEEDMRMTNDEGRVAHGQLKLGDEIVGPASCLGTACAVRLELSRQHELEAAAAAELALELDVAAER